MTAFPSIPIGNKKLFRALRDAGVQAEPLRNVPWITTSGDGHIVMNTWRSQLENRGTEIVAVINARSWKGAGIRERKRKMVIEGLSGKANQLIRVVILEERISGNRLVKSASCDSAYWLVEDTGKEFLLWRGRKPLNEQVDIPATPEGFGTITPDRYEFVSLRIERDARVRRLTMLRAHNRCEIPKCRDADDYESLDVHHITALGKKGSDHTDNTVALCPACHSRLHRGVPSVRRALERAVLRVQTTR